ncbi:MAG: restriction endonuclease subunit M [Elusimicrobia bacterium HGW-Elusimicrobia-2]|nr:MAG: restriction endonuclease subunit M [Elusimicrobia bacterium HGW-Elusimicrobia-2]
MRNSSEIFTVKQASEWASKHLKRNVTTSNISYLIQYGKVKKFRDNGNALIKKADLEDYYNSFLGRREINWKAKLGDDLNWKLSFDYLKEADTTKHVHRLHPYKGKFIPQLVEYFLDDNTDDFKKEIYFKKGDIVLDPFCGSGTALVQANELGIHAIGTDISAFNVMISNTKIGKYDLTKLLYEIGKITNALRQFIADSNTVKFEAHLLEELKKFNNNYFPSPKFRYEVRRGEINEEKYGNEKAKQFLTIYSNLVKQYGIQLKQNKSDTFLDKWYLEHVREEIDFVYNFVEKVKDLNSRKIIKIILSRTIRSCRATTHSDLATLKELITTTYYCSKHGKICKPLFSILSWWKRYSEDTIQRLCAFDKLRTDTFQKCLTGDARTINIFSKFRRTRNKFDILLKEQKIKGIFSSPPYVGLINYHEQHAYAYDLFAFDRKDDLEIGPLFRGQGNEAKKTYVQGISDVLNNCKKFLATDFHVFLVANDKFNLYPTIAEKSGMKIVNQFKRPVLNRTERDKGAYSEIIFHLRSK